MALLARPSPSLYWQPPTGMRPATGHPLMPAVGWVFHQNGGTRVEEMRGRANPATLDANTTWGPGRTGVGLKFNGTNAKTTVTDADVLTPAPITVATRIRVDSGNNTFRGVYGKDDNNTLRDYSLHITSGNTFRLRIINSGNTLNQNDFGLVTIGKPTDVLWTWDLSVVRMYQDGIQKNQSNFSGTALKNSTLDLTFGFWNNFWLPGVMEFFYIYDRALTPAEVLDLTRNPYPMYRPLAVPLSSVPAPVTVLSRRTLSGRVGSRSGLDVSLTGH